MNAPLNISMPVEASADPKAYNLLIDGKHVDAADGRSLERRSPGHGFVVSRYAQAGEKDVDACREGRAQGIRERTMAAHEG